MKLRHTPALVVEARRSRVSSAVDLKCRQPLTEYTLFWIDTSFLRRVPAVQRTTFACLTTLPACLHIDQATMTAHDHIMTFLLRPHLQISCLHSHMAHHLLMTLITAMAETLGDLQIIQSAGMALHFATIALRPSTLGSRII